MQHIKSETKSLNYTFSSFYLTNQILHNQWGIKLAYNNETNSTKSAMAFSNTSYVHGQPRFTSNE